MHLKLTNGKPSHYPYTLGELRRDNPETSFPKHIPNETLVAFGVYPVTQTAAPQVNSLTHRVKQSVELVENQWTQTWVVENLPLDKTSDNIRAKRDRLLKETDWVVVMHTEKGTNIPAEWELYRQALRDITNHVNFPYLAEEDWPVKP